MDGHLHGRDFRIGEWSIRPAANEISFDNATVHLEPKVMEVLLCLAERSGQVVTREELLSAVWKGTFVTDQTLTRAICELRHTFSSHENAPVLQTIAKRGYRLVGPVEPEDGKTRQFANATSNQQPTVSARPSGKQKQRERLVLGLAIVGLIAAASAVAFWVRTHTPPSGPIMVAVLPMTVDDRDPEHEKFCQRIVDDVVTNLGAKDGEVNVIDKTAITKEESTKNLDDIGKDLRVSYVVRSTLRQDGERVRISVRILATKQRAQTWARMYEQNARDLAAFEPELGRTIAADLRREFELYARNSHQK